MALSIPSPPPQWLTALSSGPLTKPKSSALPDPPGYSTALVQTGGNKGSNKKAVTVRKGPSPEEMDSLKLKKAWELALAPAKQLPMSAIGMYMTGNSLQIYSMFMVFTLFKGPLTAIFSIQPTFARLESTGNREAMWMAKLAFVACNLLALGLGIWKVNAMGLLP